MAWFRCGGGKNIKSITISADGSGSQGSGHKRSCNCYTENLGFKSWEGDCANNLPNTQAYLYGIKADGTSVELANLKTTKSGTFEKTDEYVKYRAYCYIGDDYGSASVNMTFHF